MQRKAVCRVGGMLKVKTKGSMMIAALIAVSMTGHVAAPTPHRHSAAPCQVAPAMCMANDEEVARPVIERTRPSADTKMSAYRFDARPCRIIGNFGCPRQAKMRLFRLGEPLRETLSRTFLPR